MRGAAEGGAEPFGLSWPGKGAAAARAAAPLAAALCAPSAPAEPPAPPPHALVVGDALDALKLLLAPAAASSPAARALGLCGLEGAAQVLYLDPPYNTGNTFSYSDDFGARGAREGAGRHARWLSMMYPVLLLARRLLSAEGALFVSIDDHELHHLRLLLDEVMGERQHLATVVVSLNPKGRQLGRYFATSHEYLVIYARDISRCALQAAAAVALDPRAFPRRDAGGVHRLLPLRNTNKRFNPSTRPNLRYPLYVERAEGAAEGAVRLAPPPPRAGWCVHEVLPVFGSGEPAVWRWGAALVAAQGGRLVGRRVAGRLGPRWDVFERQDAAGRRKKLRTVWLSEEVGSTDDAARELKALGLGRFETPKPLALLRRVLSLMPREALVVDLFAGSGTMGEAVARQNQADGGGRRALLVQEGAPFEGAAPAADSVAALAAARVSWALGAGGGLAVVSLGGAAEYYVDLMST